MPFSVLFVCTGNVCRSPAAELLFARHARGYDIALASAGTGGLTGRGVDEPTALALIELGVDPSHHVARRLDPGLVDTADLILTADTDHRSVILRESPEAFRRTFTVREFARLGAELDLLVAVPVPDVLRERVTDIAQQRGWVQPPEAGGDDIGDPYGAGLDVAKACVADVASAVDAVTTVLGLRNAPPAVAMV